MISFEFSPGISLIGHCTFDVMATELRFKFSEIELFIFDTAEAKKEVIAPRCKDCVPSVIGDIEIFPDR